MEIAELKIAYINKYVGVFPHIYWRSKTSGIWCRVDW